MNKSTKIKKILEEKEAKFQKMLELPLVTKAINMIRTQLPEHIHFHTVEHTLDVMKEVIFFAIIDKLPNKDIELLSIAAAYHDIGWIEKPRENEEIGAKMAASAMSAANYKKDEVQKVVSVIEDTEVRKTDNGLKQVARSNFSGYLLDADLSNFGRKDFFQARELIFHDLNLSDWKEFLIESLTFIQNHSWKTPAAKKFRERQKKKNIKLLKNLIASLD